MAEVSLQRELVKAAVGAMFGPVGKERFRVSPGAAPLLDKNRDGWVDRKELKKALEDDKVVLSLEYDSLSAGSALPREIVKGIVDELDANDGTRDGYVDLTRDGPTSLWERVKAFFGSSQDGFLASTLKDLIRLGDVVVGNKRFTRSGAVADGKPIVDLTQGVDGPTLGLR